MAYTISTHNGSTVARRHNARDREIVDREKHIDPKGHHEIWMDNDPRNAYRVLFGDAVEAYNGRQKRVDRQIDDYYQSIKRHKSMHPVYEMVVTIGSARSKPDEDLGKEILLRYAREWKEHNPNLVMIGAYYHADEAGAPHLHIDYVPVAHGYKKGPETQPGLVKALGEQGYHKKGALTAQIQWERSENGRLEEICREKGLDIIHPQRGKGVEHLHTDDYKAERTIEAYELARSDLEKALDRIRTVERTVGDGDLPEWIQEKGLLSKSYVIQAEHVDQLKEMLAARDLERVLQDLQGAYERARDVMLEPERERYAREIDEAKRKYASLLQDYKNLNRDYQWTLTDKEMAMEKVYDQERCIDNLRAYIEEKGLTKDYERHVEREINRDEAWEMEW